MSHIAIYITAVVLIGICACLVLIRGAVSIFPITANNCNWECPPGYQAEYPKVTGGQNILPGYQAEHPQTSGIYNISFVNLEEEE